MFKSKHSRRNSGDLSLENIFKAPEFGHSSSSSTNSTSQSFGCLLSSKFSPIKKSAHSNQHSTSPSQEQKLYRKMSDDISHLDLGITLEPSLFQALPSTASTREEKWRENSLSILRSMVSEIEARKQAIEVARKQRSISLESDEASKARILECEIKIANLQYQQEREELSCTTDVKKIYSNSIAEIQQTQLTMEESILRNLVSQRAEHSLEHLPSINEHDVDISPEVGPIGESRDELFYTG